MFFLAFYVWSVEQVQFGGGSQHGIVLFFRNNIENQKNCSLMIFVKISSYELVNGSP